MITPFAVDCVMAAGSGTGSSDFPPPLPPNPATMGGMARDDIRKSLDLANRGRYLIRVRAINPSGNTVDIVGYVTEVRQDGGIRVLHGDAERGQVHEFPAQSILGVTRVHGA